jgi:tetratricopeptide (TPR) repeat protein
MDLYFQGMAWQNKGMTPGNVAQARSFFDRALTADPDNVDALIESARVDVKAGAFLFVTDPLAAFAAAEAKLTKALSSVPDLARAHLYLGMVDIFTKRAAQGIAECEHALALDRNLAHAHSFIGRGKIFVGRAEETEAQVAEALRLSPRDIHLDDARGRREAPRPQWGASGRVASAGDRGQSKFPNCIFLVGRRPHAEWST